MTYRIIVGDFESMYESKAGAKNPDDVYSLNYMTTEQYVRDRRFEAHGCALKWDANKPAFWVPRPQLQYVFDRIDWSNTFFVAHHAHFDGLILTHHYNKHPAMFGCTLSMARLLLGNHIGVSLDSVRETYGLPAKTTPYN